MNLNRSLSCVSLLVAMTGFLGALPALASNVSGDEVDEQVAWEELYLAKCNPLTEIASPGPKFEGDPLTFAERVAIVTYTNSDFGLNKSLAEGAGLSECETAFVRTLDAALANLPDFVGTVYRGTSKTHNRLSIGKPYPKAFAAFTSTSVNRDVAEGFARDRLEIIDVKHGKDISRYSAAHSEGTNEKEILLPRGIRLRVKSGRNAIQSQVLTIETFEDGESRRIRKTVEVVLAEEI